MAYITFAEGDTFFTAKLNTTAWDAATDADKTAALEEATLIIDSLAHKGQKTLNTQANSYPRTPSDTTPQPIKDACAHIGQALLDGIDLDREADANAVKTHAVRGAITTTRDLSVLPAHKKAGVPSYKAWLLLFPYLETCTSVNLMRAN